MASSRIKDIKHAQRESFFLREISELFVQLSMDAPALYEVYITRVELSPDRGLCTVYFHTPAGQEGFDEKLKTLILYKPSLRAALAKASHSRYTPDLKFTYDTGIDRQNRIEDLFNKLKEEGKI